MDVNREELSGLVERLRQERDELRLKARLGSMEARDEWEELEKKWQRLSAQLADAKEGASDRAREVGGGLRVVADELEDAYRRIRARLSES